MDELGLRALTVVGAVARHRSFRGAADELAMSPSSVSHIIATVERRVGIRLFQRNTRSVSVTEAGEAFLKRVLPALQEISRAMADVHELRDRPAGLVRINASSWGADRLLPFIVEFRKAYPDIRVDLVTEGRIVDIIADGFDAGLRLESVVPRDMVAIPLGIAERLFLVGSPSYLEARGTPSNPGDLVGHECIRARYPSGTIKQWEFSRAGDYVAPKVDGGLIVGSSELAAKAAAAGVGIAFAEAREVEPFVKAGKLVTLLEPWTPPLGSEALYYPHSRLSSAAFKAFVDFVRARRTKTKRGEDPRKARAAGPKAR